MQEGEWDREEGINDRELVVRVVEARTISVTVVFKDVIVVFINPYEGLKVIGGVVAMLRDYHATEYLK